MPASSSVATETPRAKGGARVYRDSIHRLLAQAVHEQRTTGRDCDVLLSRDRIAHGTGRYLSSDAALPEHFARACSAKKYPSRPPSNTRSEAVESTPLSVTSLILNCQFSSPL